MSLKVLTTERLRTLIEETEAELRALNAELERRNEQAQHHEVDRLDQHFKEAELSLETIRDFIRSILSSSDARH